MEEIYVIIEAGHEGIEKLLYATTDKEKVIKELLRLKQIIIYDKAKMESVLSKFANEEDDECKNEWDRMLDRNEIEWEEYSNGKYNDPDAYCIQMWNGTEFKCVCTDLNTQPSKPWLM